jgi:hypothetical protein
VLLTMMALLLGANTINLGADLGAMGAALHLLLYGSTRLYVVLFAVACALLEVFMRYESYVRILKWTAASLFAYVATAFAVNIPWGQVGYHTLMPEIVWGKDYLVSIVAVLGTTITPYCFFWQSSEEAEVTLFRWGGIRGLFGRLPSKPSVTVLARRTAAGSAWVQRAFRMRCAGRQRSAISRRRAGVTRRGCSRRPLAGCAPLPPTAARALLRKCDARPVARLIQLRPLFFFWRSVDRRLICLQQFETEKQLTILLAHSIREFAIIWTRVQPRIGRGPALWRRSRGKGVTMGRRIIGIALAMFVAQGSASARADLFVFHQTSATVSDLSVSSSISINGNLSDLPTVTSRSNPINFGDLKDLFLSTNGYPTPFSLADFCPSSPGGPVACNRELSYQGFPDWFISPSAIDFIDARDENQFDITGFGASSTIYVASDYEGSPDCGITGRCFVTGYWALVPEPPALALLITGLLALGFIGLRRAATRWYAGSTLARLKTSS